MMKKLLYIIVFLMLFSPGVSANEAVFIDGEEEYNELVAEILEGRLDLDAPSLLNKLIDMIIGEVLLSKELLVNIIVVAALSGVLNVLDSSFAKGETTAITAFVGYTLVAISISQLLNTSIGYGVEVVNRLSGFITKICPTLTILMVSSGAAVSAASFSPVLSVAVYVISTVIEKLIIPMVYFSAVLGIVNNMTDKIQLGQLNAFIKSLAKWILTGILTVFTGINAIYGFSMPVLDAVSLKAVKFTVGSFVPVVGGLLADTVETVLAGAKLMKNAVGTAGIIMVVLICLVPIIKIGAIILLLRLASALIEPVSDKRITAMVTDSVAPITIVFAMVMAVAMLFIISISIIISAV